MIYLLPKKQYSKVLSSYKEQKYFFPIIGAVLENTEHGYVLVNSLEDYTSVFVIHKFGFSQYIEIDKKNDNFLEELIYSIFDKNKFLKELGIPKIRIYYSGSIFTNKIKNTDNNLYETTKRTRLNISKKINKLDELDNEFTFERLSNKNILKVDKELNLNLCNRFWNNCDDVIEKSCANIMLKKDEIVGICYFAAISNHFGEVDVLIKDVYRGKNYSYYLLNNFLMKLQDTEEKALWDCYSNNLGSMKLAMNSYFDIQYEYDFFIVNL